MHHQRLGGVADARALGLGVDHDVERAVEVGGRVDVDVAVAVTVDDDGDGRVVTDALDQRRTAARDEAVDDVGELHELDRGLVAHVVDEQHRVGGEPGLGEPVAQRVGDGQVGPQRTRRPAQDGDVARLEADAGGVAGDVGPVLVDDRDHAERDPAALDPQTVGPAPPVEHLADRVGQRGDGAKAVGHPRDARVGEAQPVERSGLEAGGLGRLDVDAVRREQVGGALLEQVGGREEGGVLVGGRGRRQPGRRGLRPPPELARREWARTWVGILRPSPAEPPCRSCVATAR